MERAGNVHSRDLAHRPPVIGHNFGPIAPSTFHMPLASIDLSTPALSLISYQVILFQLPSTPLPRLTPSCIPSLPFTSLRFASFYLYQRDFLSSLPLSRSYHLWRLSQSESQLRAVPRDALLTFPSSPACRPLNLNQKSRADGDGLDLSSGLLSSVWPDICSSLPRFVLIRSNRLANQSESCRDHIPPPTSSSRRLTRVCRSSRHHWLDKLTSTQINFVSHLASSSY